MIFPINQNNSMSLKNKWLPFFLAVFTGLGVYTLTYSLMPQGLQEIHNNKLHLFLDVLVFLLGSVFILKGNSAINSKINLYFKWNKTPFKRLAAQIFSNTIYTTLLTFILYVMVHFASGIPVSLYYYEFKNAFIIMMVIFFFFQTAYLGLYFFTQWKKSLIETENLKLESLHSQLHALQNQANPHFLFNSLNVLTTLIESNPKTAVSFVQRLADVYRYVLQKTEDHLVELREEINFINSYIFLQQNRFGNNLIAEIDVPDFFLDYYLPPYTLQILFENAIKHNIVSSEKPLLIKLFITGENTLVVENNLQPKISSPHSTGLGLKNIKNRYEILSSGNIEIINDERTFKVVVPLLLNRSIYEGINH